MKPDSSKDKMDVDAGEHEDEGGAAAPAAPTEAPAGDKNAQDPASDGIKAADEAMDGAPKENAGQDPWGGNFPLQEQQGALTAAAALFLLCAMLANMCVLCALRPCWWMTKWLLSRITERRARGARWRGDGRRGC